MDCTAEAWQAVLIEHLNQRPGMEARDLYKLLYQAIRGPEHSMLSEDLFRERLKGEWESLGNPTKDPLWEAIRPDQRLWRINLRPYKAAGGSLSDLTLACLETAQFAWGRPVELEMLWDQVVNFYKWQCWPHIGRGELDAFTTWLRINHYPAVHHSERYRSLYTPAYRLVAADTKLFTMFKDMTGSR